MMNTAPVRKTWCASELRIQNIDDSADGWLGLIHTCYTALLREVPPARERADAERAPAVTGARSFVPIDRFRPSERQRPADPSGPERSRIRPCPPRSAT